MYSQSDLNSAVDAGVMSRETVDAFKEHVSKSRKTPLGNEEHFRLITGFNDIFVVVAAIILLVAMWAIGNSFMSDQFNYVGTALMQDDYVDWGSREKGLGGIFCALTAWLLAEYFTRKRRMALPSIVLFGAFLIGLTVGLASFYLDWDYSQNGKLVGWHSDGEAYLVAYDAQSNRGFMGYSIVGLIAAVASYLYWKRFEVPVSIAGIVAALASLIIFGLLWLTAADFDSTGPLAVTLLIGIAVFGYAMWWDFSDRERETRRSDIAFWLHLLAAPLIAHPVFRLLGVNDGGEVAAGAVFAVLAIYLFFGLVAMAVDRRALLVSALAYVLIALTALFQRFGVVELNVALTALIIGSALLVLSAFWSSIRSKIIGLLPKELQDKLPPLSHLNT